MIDTAPLPETDTEQLVGTLLEIVAERTGYPVDMIDPSLDLEADLGIDSIKRVEILNKFRRVLPEAKQKQLESGIEELAGAKTLQSIIDWLRANQEQTNSSLIDSNNSNFSGKELTQIEPSGSNGNGKHDSAHPLALADSTTVTTNGNHSVVKRGVVSSISLPTQNLSDKEIAIRLAAIKMLGPLVLITADTATLAESLATLLVKHGLMPIVLKNSLEPRAVIEPVNGVVAHYNLDLQNFEAVQESLNNLQEKYGKISMLFHMQSFAENEAQANRSSAVSLLHLLKYLALNFTENKTE